MLHLVLEEAPPLPPRQCLGAAAPGDPGGNDEPHGVRAMIYALVSGCA